MVIYWLLIHDRSRSEKTSLVKPLILWYPHMDSNCGRTDYKSVLIYLKLLSFLSYLTHYTTKYMSLFRIVMLHLSLYLTLINTAVVLSFCYHDCVKVKVLTQLGIEKLKATSLLRNVPDGGVTGLYHIAQPSGSLSFALRYWHSRRFKKIYLAQVT